MKKMRFALGLAIALLVGLTSPAHAETQYRYWSFWQTSGTSWTLASVGAGSVPAEDGLVQGWRFLTAGVDVGAELAPRIAPSFEAICGTSPEPAAGNVLIALVIDYGLESDVGTTPPPPRSTCVEIARGEPSTMALARAAEVREDAGFVCGLDQIPSTGCGEEITVLSNLSTTQDEDESATSTSDATWDLIANVVTTLLGVVVFVMAWRRMMHQKAQKRRGQQGNDAAAETDEGR